MSNLRWRKNDTGGLTLQEWNIGTPIFIKGRKVWDGFQGWRSAADVFKAKRGDRYVVRVVNTQRGPRFNQYSAHSLREAMRMAKFFVGVRNGS